MADNVVVYHNPRCGTSRKALELLRSKGIEPEIVEYLESPPDASELRRILKALGIAPFDLIRSKEKLFRELGLDRPELSEPELIDAMVRHPILIERPIVLKGAKGVLARPAERALDLL